MSEQQDGVFGGQLPPLPPQPPAQPPPASPRRRGRAGWWLLLGLALVAVGVVARVAQRQPPAPTQAPAVETPQERGTRSVTLYFGSGDGEGVVGETRTIQSQVHREQEVEAVVNELLRGPQERQSVRLFPEGTRLRRAFYDEDGRVLYLDFTSALVAGQIAGSAMEILTLTTLLRTIAVDFPEVLAVQLLVDGLEVETLGGHIDLTRPLRAKDWM